MSLQHDSEHDHDPAFADAVDAPRTQRCSTASSVGPPPTCAARWSTRPRNRPATSTSSCSRDRGRTGDRVAGFNGLITAMRLATTAVSLLLVSTSGDTSMSLRIWTAVIVAYAIFRAFRPITYADDIASLVRVLAEVALHVVAVAATGAWDSPLHLHAADGGHRRRPGAWVRLLAARRDRHRPGHHLPVRRSRPTTAARP